MSACSNTARSGGARGTSASTYMLIGESGSGKTALLKRFCAKHPMRFEEEQDVHPVLFVEVPVQDHPQGLGRVHPCQPGCIRPVEPD